MTRFRLSLVLLALLLPTLVLSLPAAAPFRRVSFDGVPPVRIGMSVRQAEHALRDKLEMETPKDEDSNACAYFSSTKRFLGLSYMVEDGRITRMDILGSGRRSLFKSAKGIGVGSTIPAIKQAYDTSGKWHPNAYDDEPIFEIKSSDGRSAVLFETENGKVRHIVVGRLPSAEYIEGCE